MLPHARDTPGEKIGAACPVCPGNVVSNISDAL